MPCTWEGARTCDCKCHNRSPTPCPNCQELARREALEQVAERDVALDKAVLRVAERRSFRISRLRFLKAEVERLRTALHDIEDMPCLPSEPTALLLRKLARAALRGEGGEVSDPCDGADYKVLWQQMQGRAEAAEAEVARLRHELDDAKRSRDDAVGRYVESTSAFSRASESNRARQRGILLPRRSPAALPAAAPVRASPGSHLGVLEAEVERLKVERDEAWSAANSAEAKLAEALKNNDPASYSSMVYWREKCYEARAEVERLRAVLLEIDVEAGCPAAEYVPALVRIWEIARAALSGEGEKP